MTASPLYPVVMNAFAETYANGIAACFIWHGNVRDYTGSNTSMVKAKDYLKALCTTEGVLAKDVVVFYDRSQGITFALPSMEKKAKQLLGMEQDIPANPALAALAQTTGQKIGGDTQWPKGPVEALEILERLIDNKKGVSVTVIIDYAETLIPAADKATMAPADRTALVTLCRWGEKPMGNWMVVLITKNLYDLHADIRSAAYKFEPIEIPLPDAALREKYIAAYTTQRDTQLDTTVKTAANLTAGLSLIGIEDVLLKAGKQALTETMIIERANAIIKLEFGNVAEVVTSSIRMADLKGNPALDDLIRNDIIRPLREGDANHAPKGVLFMGVPGTGKSVRIKAIANEAGVRLLKLNIGGSIASKWQGEGERNLMAFLNLVKVFTPCLVWIGEVDQVLRRSEGGENRQESRIFQILMEFMADPENEGKVCFIFDTNRPDLMDSALKRAGRIDQKIGFFPPEPEERKAVMEYVCASRLKTKVEITDEMIELTDFWVHADLDEAGKKADRLLYSGKAKTAADAFLMALKSTRPSVTQASMIPMIRAIIRDITDEEMIPARFRTINVDQDAPAVEKPDEARRGFGIAL